MTDRLKGLLDVSRALALLVLLALTPVGCGAESDGGQSPVTTVEAPAETVEIDTQGPDELHGPEENDADDDGEEDDEDKGKGKGKARGHDKKEEDQGRLKPLRPGHGQDGAA